MRVEGNIFSPGARVYQDGWMLRRAGYRRSGVLERKMGSERMGRVFNVFLNLG